MAKTKPYHYLKMYREWMEAGKMPNSGLCFYFQHDELFGLFVPSSLEEIELTTEKLPVLFWGAETYKELAQFGFGPRRQTIVLFLAAMNNEL